MQNPLQKLRQSPIVFDKPGILSGILKALASSHTFTTYQCLQKCVGIFLFC